MDGLAANLLSFAHTVFGPGIWPGDWIWATIAAGFFLAFFPILASCLVALVRKGTGNAYNGTTITVFAVIGLAFALVIPWVLANGISQIYQAVATNQPSPTGLSGKELSTLVQDGSLLIGKQSDFLGNGQNVYEALSRPGHGPGFIVDIARLVVLPGLSLLFVILQARMAMRRGPRWPGRLIWISFLLFLMFSVGLTANTAFLLWIGALLANVLGLIPVLVIGPPSWSTINRSVQEDRPPAPPQQQQAMPPQQRHPQQSSQMSQQMSPAQQQLAAYKMPPPSQQRPPTNVPPLLSGQAPGSELLSGRQQPAKLADTPGPLPFPLAGGVMPPKPPPPPTRQANNSSMWKHASGRFQKIRALGHGGFGTVYLAMDTQLDRTVAVKMAHAPDAEAEQRMLREARALAAVRHPNCVRVYDIVEDEDGLGIVMEFIEGEALADAVSEHGPLDDIAAARLWVTMAGALSAAHAKGVLHRDIKPSNIMIDPSGMPHLIDFGIARAKGDSTLTKTGMMVGTPDFLAPETAAGAPATPASDAWQLAATVSYALTGEPPRGVRDNPMAALMAAARAERITHLPNQSVHFRLIAAALGPDVANRPTLETVIRQTGGWLNNNGHQEDGPITKVVKREDIEALDRTKITNPERTKLTNPERTTVTDPRQQNQQNQQNRGQQADAQPQDVERTRITDPRQQNRGPQADASSPGVDRTTITDPRQQGRGPQADAPQDVERTKITDPRQQNRGQQADAPQDVERTRITDPRQQADARPQDPPPATQSDDDDPDRTQSTSASNPDRAQKATDDRPRDPERAQIRKPVPPPPDVDRTQITPPQNQPRVPQPPVAPPPPDLDRTRPTKKHQPTKRFGV